MVHIVSVWECDIVGTCAVLILGLEEDDRPTYAELSVKPRQGSTYGHTIRDLRLCYDWRDMLDVVL